MSADSRAIELPIQNSEEPKVLEEGEPLRGNCERWPKNTIGRKETKNEGAKG